MVNTKQMLQYFIRFKLFLKCTVRLNSSWVIWRTVERILEIGFSEGLVWRNNRLHLKCNTFGHVILSLFYVICTHLVKALGSNRYLSIIPILKLALQLAGSWSNYSEVKTLHLYYNNIYWNGQNNRKYRQVLLDFHKLKKTQIQYTIISLTASSATQEIWRIYNLPQISENW